MVIEGKINLSLGGLENIIQAISCFDRSLQLIKSDTEKIDVLLSNSAIEDLIQAEMLNSSEAYLGEINRLLEQHTEIWISTIAYYQEKSENREENLRLNKVIDQYARRIKQQNIVEDEVAVAREHK